MTNPQDGQRLRDMDFAGLRRALRGVFRDVLRLTGGNDEAVR